MTISISQPFPALRFGKEHHNHNIVVVSQIPQQSNKLSELALKAVPDADVVTLSRTPGPNKCANVDLVINTQGRRSPLDHLTDFGVLEQLRSCPAGGPKTLMVDGGDDYIEETEGPHRAIGENASEDEIVGVIKELVLGRQEQTIKAQPKQAVAAFA